MRRTVLAGLAAALLLLGVAAPALHATPASADPAFSLQMGPLPLHDATVMQSMAFDPTTQTWVFAQVMGTGHFGQTATTHARQGDLTLTRVNRHGWTTSYMYLRGFGHGISIGLQPVGDTLWVWAEARSSYRPAVGATDIAGGYGTQIARFAWQDAVTLTSTSPGVERFADNAGSAAYQSPSLDPADGLIGVRYLSTDLQAMRWAVYRLADFQAHHYVALERVTIPAAVSTTVIQGWSLDGPGTLLSYNGEAYGPDNPPPGDTTLSAVAPDGTVQQRTSVDAGADLDFREPEGLVVLDGNQCVGFASGPGGGRLASVYCESSPYAQVRPPPGGGPPPAAAVSPGTR